LPVIAGLFLLNSRRHGLATLGGGFLAVSPLAFLICLAAADSFRPGDSPFCSRQRCDRDSSRAGFVDLQHPRCIVIYCHIWRLSDRVRFLIDWNRKYHELWLDRKNAGKKTGTGE